MFLFTQVSITWKAPSCGETAHRTQPCALLPLNLQSQPSNVLDLDGGQDLKYPEGAGASVPMAVR